MSYFIEHDHDTNTSKYFVDGCLIATLCFDTDTFTIVDEDGFFEDAEQSVFDSMYDEMMREKNRYDANKGYDVRAEQGLFGYGY